MNIYLVERTDGYGYDDYDSFICYANNATEAEELSPDEYRVYRNGKWYFQYSDGTEREDNVGSWTSPDKVKVTQLAPEFEGYALKPKVILASFNAG